MLSNPGGFIPSPKKNPVTVSIKRPLHIDIPEQTTIIPLTIINSLFGFV